MARPPPDALDDHNARMNAEANAAWHRANPDYRTITTMPHVSQMFQSKYITRADVDPPVIATIRAVTPEQFRGRDGAGPETKWILWFNEAKKGLKLNSTNIRTLSDGFGEYTENWIGQRVRLYVDATVMMAGQTVGGVRIQCPRSAHPAAFAAPAAPPGAFGQAARAPAQPAGAFPAQPQSAPPPGAFAQVDRATGEIRNPTPATSAVDPEFDDDIPF